MAKKEPFKPEDHFRNLKGQQYLEVKWRLVWFLEEHPHGSITPTLLSHDPDLGAAVFSATVSYETPEGKTVATTAHGSETRKDFADYLEKSETKAVGRALAFLGYGTQFAQELEEEHRIVDSPVDTRRQAQTQHQAGQQTEQAADAGATAQTAQTPDQDAAALQDRYIKRIVSLEKEKIQRGKIAEVRKAWAIETNATVENIANPVQWNLAQLESYGKFLSAMKVDPEATKEQTAAKGAAA